MPHPGGRPRGPKYIATDEQRAMVRSMGAAGLAWQTIQSCLPGAPKDQKTFVRLFQTELVTSPHLVTAKAVSKLVAAIDRSEAWAICFWLKTKAGFRETERHEITGVEGGPVEHKIIVEYVDAPSKAPASTPRTG